MKKKSLLLLTGLLITLSIYGCGKKETATEATTTATAETEEDRDAEITGYLVEDADQYITLGTYKGIDVEKPIYEVTADALDSEVQSQIYGYATTQEVTRGAQMGDSLTIDYTASIDGTENDTQSDYYLELGYEDFGPDFDEQLVGAKAGDVKEFSCTFGDDSWYEEWIGKTVDFKVTVTKVEETILPDYTDDFVKTEMGYDSKEAFEADVKASLEEANNEQSLSEASENAMLAALDTCTFNGYPDDLYTACQQTVKDSYNEFADAFGMDESEVYDAFGISDSDLEDEITDAVNRRLFISALCKAEGLTLTNGEYTDYIESQYTYYGYENAQTFEESAGKDTLIWQLYEAKADEFLLNNASISEVPGDLGDEDLSLEEDTESDTSDALEGLSDEAEPATETVSEAAEAQTDASSEEIEVIAETETEALSE